MRFITAACIAGASLQLAAATVEGQAHFGSVPLISPDTNFDSEGRETFVGHQVWRLDISEQQDVVKRQVMDLLDLLNLDIWHASPARIDVRVPPTVATTLKTLLSSHLTDHTEMISDLQPLVDASQPDVTRSMTEFDTSTLDSEFHNAYHSLEDLYAFGDQLVRDFPGLVEGFTVGYGAEGREIKGWKASKPADPLREEQRLLKTGKRKGHKHRGQQTLEFVIQGGSHAREWVAPSSIMYFLHSMLLEAREDPDGDTANLLEIFTFVTIPTINPDGFVYSMEKSRMWRKNRQDTGSAVCQGIDLNRNWGYKWTDRRSPTICSDSYPGASAFQSPETSAVANYLINGTALAPAARKVEAFVDLHSYGQLFMFPFAHSCSDFPPDAETLMEAGLGVAKAMRGRHGQPYQAGQACDLTFRAPGDAIDYSYGVADVRWSYSSELRDTGTYGFMLPPHLIRPAAEEATAGLVWLASFIATLERL